MKPFEQLIALHEMTGSQFTQIDSRNGIKLTTKPFVSLITGFGDKEAVWYKRKELLLRNYLPHSNNSFIVHRQSQNDMGVSKPIFCKIQLQLIKSMVCLKSAELNCKQTCTAKIQFLLTI